MSDVLQTAHKYRHKLKAELAKVEEFLRFGEKLSKSSGAESYSPLKNETYNSAQSEDRTAEPMRPSVDRAAADESNESSAIEKNERKSLFRSAFEPIESERSQAVA